MSCRKCPHHVRHGQVASDGKSIEFHERCGLRMKNGSQEDCGHFPFVARFDYQSCSTYIHVFKTAGASNDVMPTSDIQYSERLAANSITDMELL